MRAARRCARKHAVSRGRCGRGAELAFARDGSEVARVHAAVKQDVVSRCPWRCCCFGAGARTLFGGSAEKGNPPR